mgnify:CR=1 FL=1
MYYNVWSSGQELDPCSITSWVRVLPYHDSDGRVKDWPQMLQCALWVDRTTHSSMTGYMPVEYECIMTVFTLSLWTILV